MRKLVLILVFAVMLSASISPTLAAADCSLSYPVQLAPDEATSGHITGAFSTHRATPGAATGVQVLAPAQFTVLGQHCVGGYSWVQLQYTSGVTETGKQASTLGAGWALESQILPDAFYGAGYWLRPGSGNQGGGTTPPPASNDCSLSLATQFGTSGASTGKIAAAYSTHRATPGALNGVAVLAPAQFTVLGQRCVGGYSWVQLQYTSGVTETGKQASTLGTGWALESQIYADAYHGAGRWLSQ